MEGFFTEPHQTDAQWDGLDIYRKTDNAGKHTYRYAIKGQWVDVDENPILIEILHAESEHRIQARNDEFAAIEQQHADRIQAFIDEHTPQ